MAKLIPLSRIPYAAREDEGREENVMTETVLKLDFTETEALRILLDPDANDDDKETAREVLLAALADAP